MKLIEPSYKIIEQGPGLSGIYKAIEQAGRTCYKSEDKITDTSAKEFVDRMVKSKHYAMLEFGTVYLKVPVELVESTRKYGSNFTHLEKDKYTKTIYDGKWYYYTTNYRVIIENDLQGVLEYLCEPTEYHDKRVCVRFTTDRGISHELVRHRVFSFAQESTRYCNYSKDKFNNEITYIIPSWLDKELVQKALETYEGNGWEPDIDRLSILFIINLIQAESTYNAFLDKETFNLTPQQARQILPNALKTEINMCGFISDWEHVFELRDNKAAHPDMQAIMKPLHDEFNKKYKLNPDEIEQK